MPKKNKTPVRSIQRMKQTSLRRPRRSVKRITLADVLETAMLDLEMGVNEFAKKVGVGHSTISKHLNRRRRPEPSITFILKLARALEVSPITLLGIAFPEIADRLPYEPSLLATAERISKLPEAVQDFIRTAALTNQSSRNTRKVIK